MNPRPLIHVGYHKTGSSWLQAHLFGADGSSFELPWTVDQIARQLVDPHPFEFDPDAVRSAIESGLRQSIEAGRTPVMSCEELSGNPQSGGYANQLVADRLHRIVPEARILIVIREQRSMIRSCYRQYVRMGGVASLARYLHPTSVGPRVPRFRFDNFAYHHLIGHYQSLFGADQVQVLPFEALRADQTSFVRSITSFAGVPVPEGLPTERVYASHSGCTAALQRQLNRLFGHTSVNPGAPLHTWRLKWWYEQLDRILPASLGRWFDGRLDRQIEHAVGDRYVRSNRDLVRMTDLDLASFGYMMDPGASDV